MATSKSTKVIAGGLLVITVVSTGCATARESFVSFPKNGQDPYKMAFDQTECEAVAKGHKGDTATAALMGGAIGGVAQGAVGAAGGAIIGSIFNGAGRGAAAGGLAGLAIGAIGGAIGGIVENERRYKSVFAACMRSRNYELGG
jgi:MFS family permease